MPPKFEWDNNKSYSNLKKHKFSFLEIEKLCASTHLQDILDTGRKYNEDRFLSIIYRNDLKPILLSYCYRNNEQTVRFISARLATNPELEEFRSYS